MAFRRAASGALGTSCASALQLVEDNAIVAMAERVTLEEYGFYVLIAHTGEQAIDTVGNSSRIDVARSGIWTVSEDRSELECVMLYTAQQELHSSGATLRTENYPVFLETLLTEARIYAGTAQTDRRTRELTAGYLKPLGIASVLDSGIIVAGEFVGIVCCEHIGTERKWYADEEAFAGVIAAMVAQLYLNTQRKQAVNAFHRQLEEKNTVLREVHHRIKNNFAAVESLLRLHSDRVRHRR